MTAANVYQQRPTTGAKAESSLHHADLASLIGKGRKNAGVTVREKKLLGHLTIRGDGHDAAFAAGVHKALGIELPGALTVIVNGDTSLQWLGPDEWLLVVPSGEEFAAEQNLRAALGDLQLAGAAFAVGAGKRAGRGAEELGFEQVMGNGRAVDADKCFVRPRRGAVDRLGQQLLAGAGFAEQQHRRLGTRTAPCAAFDFEAGGAGADKVRKGVLALA